MSFTIDLGLLKIKNIEYPKENPIKDVKDVKEIMREMMSVIPEGALDGELEDELGYSKYDHKNKETKNSRNGCSNKIIGIDMNGKKIFSVCM